MPLPALPTFGTIAPSAQSWPARSAGLVFVFAFHAILLGLLWHYRPLTHAAPTKTLFVDFVAPPLPEKRPPPERTPPRPQTVAKPQPRQLVAQTPVHTPDEPVAPPPPAEPAPEPTPPAPPMPLPSRSVTLNAELSVGCPERPAPAYPPQARRLGEEGTVLLRVELDEQGRVDHIRIQNSSGYNRLDEAAIAAVRNWRCQAAMQQGRPVRAVALQPFRFVLQGH